MLKPQIAKIAVLSYFGIYHFTLEKTKQKQNLFQPLELRKIRLHPSKWQKFKIGFKKMIINNNGESDQ